MTLEQAVAILNQRKHRNFAGWTSGPDGFTEGDYDSRYLAEFEAIAIAEKYTGGWIGVEERLPEEKGRYLVHCPCADPDKPLIAVAWYFPDEGQWTLLPQMWIDGIDHWMKVPAPPPST